MNMPERYVNLDFHIDTNRINSKAQLKHMNILEHWHKLDIISIEMSLIAQEEATQGTNSLRTEKAYTYIFTETLASTRSEQEILIQLQDILFPHGVKSPNERNDVVIVFNAQKYDAILVTADGASKRQPNGILGNAEELRRLRIQVLRDHEAVELVKKKIQNRDQRAKRVSQITGQKLPCWVGRDLDILRAP